jgi:hypothetical protein
VAVYEPLKLAMLGINVASDEQGGCIFGPPFPNFQFHEPQTELVCLQDGIGA